MSDQEVPTGAPDHVLALVFAAVDGDLLTDVDSLTAGLARAGWARTSASDLWTHADDPDWVIVCAPQSAHISIFRSEADSVVIGTGDLVRTQLDSGPARGLARSDDDPHWTVWSGSDVVLALDASPSRGRGDRAVRAMLQLTIERRALPEG